MLSLLLFLLLISELCPMVLLLPTTLYLASPLAHASGQRKVTELYVKTCLYSMFRNRNWE